MSERAAGDTLVFSALLKPKVLNPLTLGYQSDHLLLADALNSVDMNRHLSIPPGGMYEEWECLIDLVEEDTAKWLEDIAQRKGWREVKRDEVANMGFDELLDWSIPDTDVLVLIGDKYLVCLNKDDYQSSIC